MSDEINHENKLGHGSYEREDLKVSGILYFLLGLGVATLLCIVALRGIYAFLEHREKSLEPPVSPLITNVPADTRHVVKGYPQSAFPNPKLEEDERGQLDTIRMKEENTLYSYGWVDEKAGTVHIPIERAMDLLVQRGLGVSPQDTPAGATPVRGQAAAAQSTARPKDKKK